MKSLLTPILFTLLLAPASLIRTAAIDAQSGSFIDDLLHRGGFSAADVRAAHSGRAVVVSLETPVRRELAHVGVVHIAATVDRFIERFRNIERFESGPGVPQIGRFSTPPQIGDFAALKLPAKDIAALRQCRPGACDLNLSKEAIARVRAEVNWSAPTAASDAERLMHQLMLGTLQAYQIGGNAALGRYDHQDQPVIVADEFRALLKSTHRLPIPVPELVGYLDDYPRKRLDKAEDLLYWAVVDFGLKPTVRLNHVVIYPPPGKPSGVSYVIAIRQIYATHYFHTTLEWRFLIEDPRRQGFYLLSITRSRNDGTTGFTGSILRPIINRRSRNGVRGYLEYLKLQVERQPDQSR